MENNWYVAVNGETYGPYTWEELYKMTKTGNISALSMIFHEQLGAWVEAHTVKELGLSVANVSQQPLMAGGYNQQTINQHGQPKKKGKGCLSFVGIVLICFVLLGVFVIKPLLSKEMMKLGRADIVAEQDIDQDGGTIKVEDLKSEIDGLTLEVPKGAYDEKLDFKISTRVIKSHDFGEKLNPVTPIIHVDNGGDMAEKFMTMTIPIDIDKNEIALACYYKEDGTLEPISIVSSSENEIVIGVRHFSDIVVTALEKTLLDEYVGSVDFDSGFRPGFDNWSFVNNGSELEDGGICAGMSLSMIHYYIHHGCKGEVPLHAYLDNNHYNSTSDFDKDDSLGVRLASIVQADANWSNYESWYYDVLHQEKFLTDKQVYYQFAYAFMLTDGSPQAVSLWVRTIKDGAVKLSGGHAIVAYAITKDGIYVCDPNYPDRTDLGIPFNGKEFDTYNTALEAGASTYNYNSFALLGTTSLYPYEDMEELFDEAKKSPYESTIGDGRFSDAKFKALILDEDQAIWVENVEVIEYSPEDSAKYKTKVLEYLTNNGLESVKNRAPADWGDKAYLLIEAISNNEKGALEMYMNNNSKPFFDYVIGNHHYEYVPLELGLNNLGIYYSVELSHSETIDGVVQRWKSYEFTDFMRANIYYGEIDLTGTWKGEFQIVNYEKALNYAEEVGFQIAKGITGVLMKMFGQDLSNEEIEAIARESIEVNESLTDSMPMTLILSNKKGNTYDARITLETDTVNEFDVEAEFDGEALIFKVKYDDGAVMTFKYYVYSNENLSGEFEIKYGVVNDFMSGVSELDKN